MFRRMSDLPPDALTSPRPPSCRQGGSRRAIAIVVGSLLVAIIGGLFGKHCPTVMMAVAMM